MHIKVRQLVYFLAVADAGSTSRAASTLNVSQSVVTEAVQRLEGTVGAELFTRHARGMTLTHAGHQFLRHANEVLAALRNAESALRERPDTLTGTLHVGVTSLVTAYHLPYLLGHFERVFPNVRVVVREDRRSDLEHRLIGGEVDVAVMNLSGSLDRGALETRTLLRTPWRVWLPTNHPLTARERVSLSDLRGERLLVLRSDEVEDVTALVLSGGADVRVRTSSVEAMRSLVAVGVGVALLPDLLYRPWSLEGDRLEARPLQEDLPRLELGVVWRRGSALPEVARQFLVVTGEFARVQPHGVRARD
ncbi:LysR family transcriptional regulator [Deinococcus pimensis]|uniref:LysR family transcriptional regulator n=1 Tax=Deinococcus pimensis TaxID=309888 RepID=UPI00047FAD13|nr:LysR family transcriptional regulator [Deinococcus pimensis]